MSANSSGASRKLINSRLENMRNLSPAERLAKVADATSLSTEEAAVFSHQGLPLHLANGMIENVIGVFELPIGIATNFRINERDYLVPMAVEEPSVVAGASYMAKIARQCGGFQTSSTGPLMRAQIQVIGLTNPYGARMCILQERDAIIAAANAKDKVLISLGGGCQDVEVHIFEDTQIGPMIAVHLIVDVRDAMGANTVNTMAETVAPMIAKMTGGTVRLRILSNYADLRLARAMVRLTPEALATQDYTGERIAQGVIEACAFALADPYRAATHNKGIMNGVDPVVVATGNDWRAIEAGAHVWASRSGRYTSLSHWELTTDGDLIGTLEMPMALGLVGGATKTHPAARAALKILGVQTAQELAEVTVAVGLAQNLAALRALATEGIQKGHMALHARNIAIVAGAIDNEVDVIATRLAADHDVRVDRAKELLELMRNG